ncbi:hypothetical protein F5144DRAFT_582489 [Chaetomium tenue]|uniref:Uncharacterized protein n=1 Tax=Chaetomium tenue TaxID=1854479 RepID=A0ACB7P0S0_9PEZI|nr:hypothetical protein F5144DRAFT_582489 [Chaetomium globosum]
MLLSLGPVLFSFGHPPLIHLCLVPHPVFFSYPFSLLFISPISSLDYFCFSFPFSRLFQTAPPLSFRFFIAFPCLFSVIAPFCLQLRIQVIGGPDTFGLRSFPFRYPCID